MAEKRYTQTELDAEIRQAEKELGKLNAVNHKAITKRLKQLENRWKRSKTMIEHDIYYHDLTPEAQEELCKNFKTTPEDENWDIYPLTVLCREETED